MLTQKSVLASVLGLDPTDILADGRTLYKAFTIAPRRKGTAPRQILAPCDDLKTVQKALLDKILRHVAPHPAATSFFPGRSVALNARQHHLCRYLYKTDIRDFFGSITAERVLLVLQQHFPHLSVAAASEIVTLTTLNGVLPQGAPTSPHLANLALFEFDDRLSRLCAQCGANYSRYADDIAVSAEDANTLHRLAEAIGSGLTALQLAQHPAKTRSYGPDARKIVTGLDVSGAMIRPPRRYRKKAAALVRMCECYPSRMARHVPRVLGFLAHWQGTAPQDRDLHGLLLRMQAAIARI